MAPDPGIDGSWLQFRHDRKLTGRSPLTADITCPKVLWRHDLGARMTWIAITPGGPTEGSITLPTSGETGNYWEVREEYETSGRMIDLDNDSRNMVSTSAKGNHKVGDYLPDLPGFERISCDTGSFQTGRGGDDPLPCYLQNRQKGEWKTVWTSQALTGFSDNMSTNGEILVGDFDDDGGLEAAVLPWYDMHLLDLATGEVEQTANFQASKTDDDPTTGRAYGWFGAFNLDDDPKSEFIILGDFEMFVSVIGWKDGRLTELWDYQIEAGTQSNKASHHTGVNPVSDIDGDGRPEIVSSIYNEDSDGEWHVVVLDGLTGEVEIDLLGAYLSGLRDIDRDGVAEMFVTRTAGRVIPEYGEIVIYSAYRGSLAPIWSTKSSGFETYDVPGFPDHVNSRATHYRRSMFFRDDWQQGGAVFITKEIGPNKGEIRLRIHQSIAGTITDIGAVTGPDLSVISLPTDSPRKGVLIQSITSATDQDQVRVSDLRGRIVYSGRVHREDGHEASQGSLLTGPVAATLSPEDKPTLIVQGFGEKIHGLQVSGDGDELQEQWQVPGRGMVSGSSTFAPHGFISPLIADVSGTGELATVVAGRLPDGRGIIQTLDPSGDVIWEAPFDTPGEPAIWNEAGITNWIAGHFTDRTHEDILVSVRTGKMHTDQSYLLDGPTGELLWKRTLGGYYSGCGEEHPTGAGGAHMAAFDWDGDGLDEVLNLYSSLFAVYDGEDGSLLINRWATGWCPSHLQLFSEGFLKHPYPVIGDFMATGSDQILFSGNDATLAVLEANGDPIWHTPLFSGMPRQTMPGIGDLNADGHIDLVSVRHCGDDYGEVRAFSGKTGEVRWGLDLPVVCESWHLPTHVAMADIDGDGRDEALFTQANLLYAVGENGKGEGELLWKAVFGPDSWNGQTGDVVIADIDGSGHAQILVTTASGYLYGLGPDG